MEGALRAEDAPTARRIGRVLAAAALSAALLVAPSGNDAAADTAGTDTTSSQTETAGPTAETHTERGDVRAERGDSDLGPSQRRNALRANQRDETESSAEIDATLEPETTLETEPTDARSTRETADDDTGTREPAPDLVDTQPEPQAPPAARRTATAPQPTTVERPERSVRRASTRLLTPARTDGPTARPTVAQLSVETLAPVAPQPLSPLAELLTFPARLVNAVLQVLDLTATANRPDDRPHGLQPINDLIFGAFREIERLLGLHRPPPPQPEIPTLTYTGPVTRPTPTVAQFLNASAAGYVLGSTPGGLVPFTVNGFQLASTNIFSGMVAKTWVTPEGQLIIAYQGTTGGSHLLFNPLITISQILADLQVVFTRTTPLAFYHALSFAERVQTAAAKQGYTSDDIFVTGHSLGGWEAQFVAQQTGLAGIGFEAPGMNTRTPGNGADSMFVNIGTYGSSAPYLASDLPGLQPFMPRFAPGGGTKPHFGPIVMIGDPAAMTPLYNASALWGRSLIGSMIFLVDFLGNFFQYHLPGVQAYHLDVKPDPGMVTFLGTARGPVHTGYGTLTIPELMKRASDDGILFRP
ncbi:hypothetical protein ACAG25_12010 [Mycobacterium sp. pV006]|uniref:hypothetical protein n=1 Tax=Mycobacterium sp. pV006 TaxID=3238983 RepID=UPI00351B540C